MTSSAQPAGLLHEVSRHERQSFARREIGRYAAKHGRNLARRFDAGLGCRGRSELGVVPGERPTGMVAQTAPAASRAQ
jgi:hypothetical protein